MSIFKTAAVTLALLLTTGSLTFIQTATPAHADATPESMKNANANAATCVGSYGDLTKEPAKNQAKVQLWQTNGTKDTAKLWANPSGKDLIGRVPVVMIHGWTGHGTDFNDDANIASPGKPATDLGGSTISLASKLKNAVIYTFDYHNVAADWVNNPDSGGALRTALNCINQVTQQRAIVITHSMGGLVTRYALNGEDRWVSRVITYNTPETGSVMARAIVDQINAVANGNTSVSESVAGKYWDKDYANKTALIGAANLTRLLLTLCGNSAGQSMQGDMCDLDSWGPIEAIGAGMTPAAAALLAGSTQITHLAPWPATLPVDAMAGDQTFNMHNITAGLFDQQETDNTFDLGDAVVSPSSAIAGASSKHMVSCNSDLTFRSTTFWSKLAAGESIINKGLQVSDVISNTAAVANFFGGACFHGNAMKSTEQTSHVIDDIAKQVAAQSQIVTYATDQPQNYGAWYVGFNGIGPYKIGQHVTDTLAAYKKIYPTATNLNYSQSITDSVQRAYDANYASFGGITGDMLACSPLSDYTLVAARYRTPTVDSNVSQNTYNTQADPAKNTTLSELIVSSDLPLGTFDYKYPKFEPQTSIGGISIGSTLKQIVNTYGSARLMNVSAAKDSLTDVAIKRYTVTSNIMNANGNLLPAYLNFFVASQDGITWKVIQITAGTDQPYFYTADTCSDLDRTKTDTASYNKNKTNNYAAWTLGFQGIGPLTYANKPSMAAVSKTTGVDYHDSTVNQYSRFGNFNMLQKNYPDLVDTVHADYMSEYQDTDEHAWQRQEKYGLNVCAPVYPDSTASLGVSFAFPFIRDDKVADWLKLDPYATSHITDLAVSGSSNGLSTGSGPESLGDYFQLPRTVDGIGLGSTLTDIKTEYAGSQYKITTWKLESNQTQYAQYSATSNPVQSLTIVQNTQDTKAPALYFMIEGNQNIASLGVDKVFAYGVTTDLFKYDEVTSFAPCVSYSS